MLILVLLGMYFDAAVVFVTSQTLFLRLALAILCRTSPGPLMIRNLRIIRRFRKVKFFMTLFLFAINR